MELEATAWRKLLESIIADAQERQRIANKLGVNAATLVRWSRGETNPRHENLQRLLQALPEQQKTLARLISEEYPTFDLGEGKDVSEQIPAEIYSRILNTYVNMQDAQRSWYMSDLIMQLALGQLDPNHLGMAITIAHCMPPSGDEHKVRSLRQNTGRGTPPWNTYLDQSLLFLGMESLAGYAVSIGHLAVVQGRNEQTFAPVRWEEWEESAVASPVRLGGRVVGCLIISSTQPGYFLEFRQKLIEQYTELLTLAFRVDEFYALRDIELSLMPSEEIQRLRFSQFRQRVSNILLEASQKQRPITLREAEQIVWADLEEELLGLPVSHHG
jgi:transcriptional regulator with XRE-family HTH domain